MALATRSGWQAAVAILFVGSLSSGAWLIRGQNSAVTAKVELVNAAPAGKSGPAKPAADQSNVIVWLVSLDSGFTRERKQVAKFPKLTQRNKSFEPHVLVVEAGSLIAFPNKDPFFHNVFSLFDGKRFDLGLYEAGTAKTARFERQGVSFVFCNIHPEMSAIVMAVDTPYFALSDRTGNVALRGIPDGRYRLHVWYERGQTDEMKELERDVEISSTARDLGRIRLNVNPNWSVAHKNKYGQDYIPPAGGTYHKP